jgi:transposase-like protein
MKFSEEEKSMWISDWQESGKSAWSYAKANGLNPQTFKKWTKPKTESQVGFVEVPATITQVQQSTDEILIERGDVKIHIPVSIGSMELRTIFSALRGVV